MLYSIKINLNIKKIFILIKNNLNNWYIATHALRNFMLLYISCNYPEASVSGIVYANNITADSTNQLSNTDPINIFGYGGPANMTANNFNLTNYYMDGTNNAGGILFVSTSYWVPHDNIPIIFSFENNTYSLSNNTYGDRFNMVIFFFDQVLYRSVKITINNFVFNELNDPHNLLFFIIGNLMSELYLNNTYLSNSAINKNVVRAYFFKNFVIDNMVLTNFTNIQASLIVTFYWYTAVINSIRLENTYFDSSLESDIILLNNFNFTYTSIQNIYFNNVTVNGHPLVRNVNLIFKVTIANWYLNNVYQAGTNPLFAIGKIGSIIFDNNTFSGITNSILHISKIDLRLGTNSQISNVRVSNSSATAITFGNFINPTSTMQTLLVENFTYTDSTISSAIDLISTKNIIVSASVNILLNLYLNSNWILCLFIFILNVF